MTGLGRQENTTRREPTKKNEEEEEKEIWKMQERETRLSIKKLQTIILSVHISNTLLLSSN